MKYNYNLKELYENEVRKKLKTSFSYKNDLQIPKLKKISFNITVIEAVADGMKALEPVLSEIAAITGQKPVITYARKSLANFKIREGMPIGAKVTLRGFKMWVFLQKFVFTVLPRVRDFKGLDKNSFDGKGNFNFGIKEHTVFLEIDYNKISRVRGLDINFETTARTDEEAKLLLELLHLPFYN